MVLSNKKLKQKIRAELAESITASQETQKSTKPKDPNDQDHQNSYKVLLDSMTQKPRLSKREKRRGKIESFQESYGSENGGFRSARIENDVDGEEGVNKKEKRKREGEGMDNGEAKMAKKPKKAKKKKNVLKEKKGGVVVVQKNVESAEQSVGVLIKGGESQENGENFNKVYVGGIPYYSTEDDIHSFFESCGTITEIYCMTFPDTGKFRGIAIISFRTEAATKRALALDGADMGGLFLKIQPYKTTVEKKVTDFSPAIVEGYNRIYVGNLSWDITEEDLKKFFSDCNVSNIRFGENKETGEFRGYAHVDFSDSLSVTLGLKLDQQIVCGRPVRIRCAVPTKKVVTSNKISDPTQRIPDSVAVSVDNVATNTDNIEMSNVNGKIRRRTCYECGQKGHLTSLCPTKLTADAVESGAIPTNADNVQLITGTDNVELSSVSGKIRRRTCYECGEKGHITSSCPKKQPAEIMSSVPTSKNFRNVASNIVEKSTSMVEASEYKVEVSTVSGKIRRRTCYECGEKGHMTSSCPNKNNAEAMNSVATSKNAYNAEVGTNIADTSRNKVVESADKGELITVSGKIQRRTCYECGEKGHMTSSCPKKNSAEAMKSVPTNKNAYNDEASTNIAEICTDNVEEGTDKVDSSAVSGKIRRRTCYECGQKGHLSSSCPNKNAAEPMNLDAS